MKRGRVGRYGARSDPYANAPPFSRSAESAELPFLGAFIGTYSAVPYAVALLSPGERVDTYAAALGFVPGATRTVAGVLIMTNLLSHPALILARTVNGLSAVRKWTYALVKNVDTWLVL